MIISGHGHRAAFNNLERFLSQRNPYRRQVRKNTEIRQVRVVGIKLISCLLCQYFVYA